MRSATGHIKREKPGARAYLRKKKRSASGRRSAPEQLSADAYPTELLGSRAAVGDTAHRPSTAPDAPVTLRGHSIEVLRGLLASGRLRPGDRINEVHLSTKLGVSRGIVREALIALEQEGAFVSIPRRGVFVRKLTRAAVADMTEVRVALEVAAAKRALQGDADRLLADARSAYRTLEGVGDGSLDLRLRAELAFHETICAASHNPALQRACKRLTFPLGLMLMQRPPAGADAFDDLVDPVAHATLLLALESRDPAVVEGAWRLHYSNWLSVLLSELVDDD